MVYVWDVRVKDCVGDFYGPNICGDSIDTTEAGDILTGSYRAYD